MGVLATIGVQKFLEDTPGEDDKEKEKAKEEEKQKEKEKQTTQSSMQPNPQTSQVVAPTLTGTRTDSYVCPIAQGKLPHYLLSSHG